MDIAFTAYLWLNVLLFGFFFGLGFQLAVAIYNAILWVLGRPAPQP
jgi:hypothetical protein